MDVLRSCYASSMRLYSDRPDVLTPGRWQFCLPGAKPVPFSHSFGSRNWDYERQLDLPIGEVLQTSRPYRKETVNSRYKGVEPCGDAEAWREGVLFEFRGTPPSDVDGVPWCCDALPLLPTGDSDGGTAAQHYGDAAWGDGGESDGGTAHQQADLYQLAAGGDSDDGAADQQADAYQRGLGGDSDDGAAEQTVTDRQLAAGGDSDDGVADQWSGDQQLADGGDSDDGVADQTVVEDEMPTGVIVGYGAAGAPAGWLSCDGSLVSRTTYAALFAVVGTSYGAGDGSTTFGVPDLRGRSMIGDGTGSGLTARALGTAYGVESVTMTTAHLVAHTHTLPTGLLANLFAGVGPYTGTAGAGQTSGSGGLGTTPIPILQPVLGCRHIIKT